eukprot:171965-Amphidinium_carterae.1
MRRVVIKFGSGTFNPKGLVVCHAGESCKMMCLPMFRCCANSQFKGLQTQPCAKMFRSQLYRSCIFTEVLVRNSK